MTREIKFRAWDTEEKVMWQPLTLDQIIRADWEFETEPYEYTLPHKDYMWSQHDKTVWMQYTGLKDKNGKEIYEGDIVNVPSFHPSRCEVIFDRGGFCMRRSKADHYYPDGKYLEGGIIIGNIWEHPELLTTSS